MDSSSDLYNNKGRVERERGRNSSNGHFPIHTHTLRMLCVSFFFHSFQVGRGWLPRPSGRVLYICYREKREGLFILLVKKNLKKKEEEVGDDCVRREREEGAAILVSLGSLSRRRRRPLLLSQRLPIASSFFPGNSNNNNKKSF